MLPSSSGPVKKGVQLKLKAQKKLDEEANKRIKEAEILNPSNPGYIEEESAMERTYKLTQEDMKKAVDVGTSKKIVNLPMNYGHYSVDVSRNGRYILMGGHKGHVAMYDTHKKTTDNLLNVPESVRAVKFFHNHTLFATAQRKYSYIYNHEGLEIHCLRDALYTSHLDFLPYHFLLVAASERAHVRWLDVTSGQVAADHNTHLGPPTAMSVSPSNAVVHLGHNNGAVTLWTPNMGTPVAKLMAHKGAVSGISVGPRNQMVTVGADGKWRAYDMRMMKKCAEFSWTGLMPGPTDINLSMTNTVALAAGPVVTVYQDPFNVAPGDVRSFTYKPYVKHSTPGEQFGCVRFSPFEDLLWTGSTSGVRSILVPGAGYANFDGYENNPFETKKQRQEAEVRALLEKLSPDTIVFDPSKIGGVDEAPRAVKLQEAIEQREADEQARLEGKKGRKKMRGKNKSGKREKKKANIYADLIKRKAADRLAMEEAQQADEMDGQPKAKRAKPSSAEGQEGEKSIEEQRAEKKNFDSLARFSQRQNWGLEGKNRKK